MYQQPGPPGAVQQPGPPQYGYGGFPQNGAPQQTNAYAPAPAAFKPPGPATQGASFGQQSGNYQQQSAPQPMQNGQQHANTQSAVAPQPQSNGFHQQTQPRPGQSNVMQPQMNQAPQGPAPNPPMSAAPGPPRPQQPQGFPGQQQNSQAQQSNPQFAPVPQPQQGMTRPGPQPPSQTPGFPSGPAQAPQPFAPGPPAPSTVQSSAAPPQAGPPGGFPPGPQFTSPAPAFPSVSGAPGAMPNVPAMPSSFPSGPGGQGAAPVGPPGNFQQGPPGAPMGPGNFQQGPPGAPMGPGNFQQGPPGAPMGPGNFQQGPAGAPQPGFPGMPGAPGGQQPGYPGMQGAAGPPQPGFPGMPGAAPMPGAPGNFQGGPPGMGGAPAYPGQQRQRLDPQHMPSAVQVMEDDAATRAGLFPTGYPTAELPPLVSTKFNAQDQGNCNPRLMRSSLYIAPASNDLLKASQLPFAVACSPFAAVANDERAPPVIDLGPNGPVRCQRCKAYICPFMEFQDGGRRFRCPFCNASTPVEDWYFAHLDHTGRRTDIEHRPECYLGAYEFLATKQYCKNGLPPKEPAFIFMIDVSYNGLQSGMVQMLTQNLESILHNLPRELGAQESVIRVGLATFDTAIHFFDLSSPQPTMMVVGDVTDVFVPIVDGLLLPLSEAQDAIRAVLGEIPRLFAHNKATEILLGPVVQAGMDALKCADRAGKLFIFTSSLPTFEAPGKLKSKDERKILGTDKEKSALVPQDEFYTRLGEQCVRNGVTVDLFLFPNAFIDVASIGQLPAVTGGSIYKYQYFQASRDGERFIGDLRHDVSRQIAFDCMVRVRSSAGIRPVNFFGSFFMENSTDLEMSSIDQDKTFYAELKHDDKLSEQHAVVQCATLFTSVSGQRRLRILNVCLPVSSDYDQLFRVSDQDTLTALLFKQAVVLNRDKSNKEMKDQLSQRCAQILSSYREKCSQNAPLGQLILPEQLKLLPLFMNSVLKNDAVSGGPEMTVDDKTYMIELVRGMGVADAMKLLYPKIVAVSDLELHEGTDLTLPHAVRCSIDFLTNDKAYVIDNGMVWFLWIGLGVGEEFAKDIFGVNSITAIDTESMVIPEKDNARSRGLRRALQLLEAEGGIRKRKLFIIREKDALEPWMRRFLIEDKSSQTSLSYVDFLCYIHREIRNILS